MDASDEHKRRHLPEVQALAKLVEDRHEEVKRLMNLSLKQGGMIISAQRQAQKEAIQHARDDAKLFQTLTVTNGAQDTAIEKLRTEQWWLKKAMIGLAAWTGLSKFIGL